MAPRFTILLPTRNRSPLLRLAIASVLDQTEPDFELLVVGDACTDDSAAVVASFGDPRIRWFDLPKAPGFGYANRNVALRQSSGRYIAFVADDDLVFPDHLERLAAAIDESGADWAYTRPLWVATDGVVVPFAINLLNSDELETFLTVCNHLPATCVMYTRRCLDAYGYWPEDVPRAGDWKYWKRIIEGGHRANLAYSPVPTSLHFNAPWKTTPDTQMGEVTAAREIAASASWWPASMKATMSADTAEQTVFDELIRRRGYVDGLRRDVTLAIERLAWMQLTDTPAAISRLRLAVLTAAANEGQAKAALEAAVSRLDAVVSSTSWRVTWPIRAVVSAIRQRGGGTASDSRTS